MMQYHLCENKITEHENENYIEFNSTQRKKCRKTKN